MNVLILTPDAVGSTLLQRMLTIYMQFHDFNRPVINCMNSPMDWLVITAQNSIKNW